MIKGFPNIVVHGLGTFTPAKDVPKEAENHSHTDQDSEARQDFEGLLAETNALKDKLRNK